MGQTLSTFDLTRRSKKYLTLGLALCVLAFVWSVRFLGPDPAQIRTTVAPYAQTVLNHARPSTNIPKEKQLDLSHLQHLVRTPIFEYSRRAIRTEHFVGKRSDLTVMDEPLAPPAIEVHKSTMSEATIPNLPPLTLRVPISPKVDTSILSFGMATTIPRLKIALPQIEHWLPSSSAQLHVLAPEHADLSNTETSGRKSGLNMTVIPTNAPFPKAYFGLLRTLYDTRTSRTKWLVLIDDDTFFPSLPTLISHLNTDYDSSTQALVSATSDNLGQIITFGLIPFGGGGIFVSLPLAERLLSDKIWSQCVNSGKDQGDQILNDCLNEHTDVRPSFDGGLNQMDIRGDEAGYFESGRRMLSVHHWRSWFDFDVALAGNVSRAAGDEAVFQRFLFGNDTVLSNGYSLARYTSNKPEQKPISEEELRGIEYTWHQGDEEERWRYMHKWGPLRPAKKPEQKKTLKLVAAEEVLALEGKAVRQIYVWRDTMPEVRDLTDNIKRPAEGARDEVVELVWLI